MTTEAAGLARFDSHVSPNAFERSASVLADGIWDGVCKRAGEAADHPVRTAVELAGAAAGAFVLSRVCMAAGPKFATGAKFALSAPLVADLANRGGHVLGAAYDTFQNPSHYDANKKTISTYGGEGVFDYTAYGIAGMVGFEAAQAKTLFGGERYGPSGWRNRWDKMRAGNADSEVVPIMSSRDGYPELTMKNLPENSPLRNLYAKQKSSVVHVGKLDANGELLGGSGFLVTEDGVVATNAHVVHGVGRGISVRTVDGGVFPARLLSRDVEADLALLKIETPPGDTRTFKSVVLADTSRGLGSREGLAVIGHPASVSESIVTPLNYIGRTGWKTERLRSPFTDPHPENEIYSQLNRESWSPSFFSKNPSLAEPKPFARTEKLFYEGPAIGGNSGSPVFDMNGRVVGVHSHSLEWRQKHGTAVEHLRTLMEVTLNREPQSGWLRLTSHMAEPPRVVPDLKVNSLGTAGSAAEIVAPGQPQSASIVKVGQYNRTPLAERLATAAEPLAAEPVSPATPPTWLDFTKQQLGRGVRAAGIASYPSWLHQLESKLK